MNETEECFQRKRTNQRQYYKSERNVEIYRNENQIKFIKDFRKLKRYLTHNFNFTHFFIQKQKPKLKSI